MYTYGLKFFQRVGEIPRQPTYSDSSSVIGARKTELELLLIPFYYGLQLGGNLVSFQTEK